MLSTASSTARRCPSPHPPPPPSFPFFASSSLLALATLARCPCCLSLICVALPTLQTGHGCQHLSPLPPPYTDCLLPAPPPLGPAAPFSCRNLLITFLVLSNYVLLMHSNLYLAGRRYLCHAPLSTPTFWARLFFELLLFGHKFLPLSDSLSLSLRFNSGYLLAAILFSASCYYLQPPAE